MRFCRNPVLVAGTPYPGGDMTNIAIELTLRISSPLIIPQPNRDFKFST
jgi:hypothetical protein